MLGAIIGDIVGSPYEFGSNKTKNFKLLGPGCRPTDDSIMTIAVGCACVEADCYDEEAFKTVLIKKMREIGNQYPDAGYGRLFYNWLTDDEPTPYGSKSNGSAMRVSPIAWAVDTIEDTERLAGWSAEITHDCSEGIRGAQAVAASIFLARTGSDKDEIRDYIEKNYYNLDFTIDEIRPGYSHDMSCDGSVPQAIACFLDSNDFEDAIRNAISLGGDCDTQACITGAISEAYYGIPDELQEEVFRYIDENLQDYYFSYSDELYR